MFDDCICTLKRLDRYCSKVSKMTPAMHEEFEKTLIELLQHAVDDNRQAMVCIRHLQHELEVTRRGLEKALAKKSSKKHNAEGCRFVNTNNPQIEVNLNHTSQHHVL